VHVDDHRDAGPDQRPAGRHDSGSLGPQLSALASALAGGDDVRSALEGVVRAAAGTLPGAEHASVTESAGEQYRTRVASSEFARTIDRIQYGTGEGPCLAALETETAVHVRDVLDDDRWPAFAEAAAATGFRSSLSLRLHGTGDRVAALNLFSTRPDAFDGGSRQVGALLARHAALALVAADQVEQLQQAVATRDVIGQAKGILMERHGLDADRAFAVLVRYSRDSNTRLRDVAETLVTSRQLPRATD
jgi:hypothetical protein